MSHAAAKLHRLKGVPCRLAMNGIAAQKTEVDSILYQVPITDKMGKRYFIDAFGLDDVCSATKLVSKESYKILCKKFGFTPEALKRPDSIDLFLGMRDTYLPPIVTKTVVKMFLYEGPLGRVLGGADPTIDKIRNKLYPTHVHMTSCNKAELKAKTGWEDIYGDIIKSLVNDNYAGELQFTMWLTKW